MYLYFYFFNKAKDEICLDGSKIKEIKPFNYFSIIYLKFLRKFILFSYMLINVIYHSIQLEYYRQSNIWGILQVIEIILLFVILIDYILIEIVLLRFVKYLVVNL